MKKTESRPTQAKNVKEVTDTTKKLSIIQSLVLNTSRFSVIHLRGSLPLEDVSARHVLHTDVVGLAGEFEPLL